MTRALLLIAAGVLVFAGFAVAVGIAVADHLYERAVADCATHGAEPAPVPDRLAYVCAPSYRKVTP